MVEKTGIPLGTLNKYTSKTSTASFTNAAKIAAAAGIQLDEIAFGEGDLVATHQMRKLQERLMTGPWLSDGGESGADFVRLPVYTEVRASAGHGAATGSEDANEIIAFGRRFLRDLGAVPDRCSIIFARGTSMKPTIPDGAILVVDHSQRDVAHGCIYVFNVCDQLLVKRARWRIDGRLELVSDNADEGCPVETVGPEMADELHVVGRVVYFCRAP